MAAIIRICKSLKTEVYILSGFILLIILLKWNTLQDPYFWDSIGIIKAALGIYENGLMYTSAAETFFHPPLVYYLLAITWKVFGYSLFISHLLTLVFGCAGIVYTYLIGKLVGGPRVGFTAISLLVFFPVFFAQLGIVHDTMFLFCVFMASLYYYLKKRYIAYAILAGVLVFMKEQFLFALGIIFIYEIIHRLSHGKRLSTKNTTLVAAPIIIFLPWLLFVYKEISEAGNVQLSAYLGDIFVNFFTMLFRYFVYDYSPIKLTHTVFIFTILIITSMVWAPKGKNSKYYVLFATLLLSFLGLFAYSDATTRYAEMPRYFVPFWPLFFILGAHALWEAQKRWKLPQGAAYLLCIIVICISVANYTGERQTVGWMLDSNMEYRDLIAVNLDTAKYIESNYPESRVIAGFPFGPAIANGHLGYVQNPLNTQNAQRYNATLIIYQNQSPIAGVDTIRDTGYLRKTFEHHGKYLEIYTMNG